MVETKLGGQGNSSQNRLWIFDLITVTSFNLWSESRIQYLSKFFVNMPWECSLDLILDSENCHRWPPSRAPLTFAGRCLPVCPYLSFSSQLHVGPTPILHSQKPHFPRLFSMCFNSVKMLLSVTPLYHTENILESVQNWQENRDCRTFLFLTSIVTL